VDWYEGLVLFDGESRKMNVFCMRSMASGAAFHRAYPHATQQAFLEAHELAFAFFGGVFHVLRYDNLKSAVKKILRGHQREETARFIGFARTGASHRSSVRPARDTRRAASRRRRAVSAELPGASSERAEPGWTESASVGGVGGRAEPRDCRAHADHRCGG